MKNSEIIPIVRALGNTKGVITRNMRNGKYVLSIMQSYSGTDGKDFFCGAACLLDIEFNLKEHAEQLEKELYGVN
jgi:hypothetical protein